MIQSFIKLFYSPSINLVLISEPAYDLPYVQSILRARKGSFRLYGDAIDCIDSYCTENEVKIKKTDSQFQRSKFRNITTIVGSASYIFTPTSFHKLMVTNFRIVADLKTKTITDPSYYGFTIRDLTKVERYNPDSIEFQYQRMVNQIIKP